MVFEIFGLEIESWPTWLSSNRASRASPPEITTLSLCQQQQQARCTVGEPPDQARAIRGPIYKTLLRARRNQQTVVVRNMQTSRENMLVLVVRDQSRPVDRSTVERIESMEFKKLSWAVTLR